MLSMPTIPDGIENGPYKVTRTARGDYWITAPCNSDSDYTEDHEPIFESSGTGPKFAATAQFLADCANYVIANNTKQENVSGSFGLDANGNSRYDQ